MKEVINMLKKLIAYQRLLLSSMPPTEINSKKLLYVFVIFAMNMFIFSGNTSSANDIAPVIFPIISVWMINKILYRCQGLFETVPVSRKYIVLNIFLLSIVIIFASYILASIVGLVLAGLVFGFLYLVYPQGFNQSPPQSAVHQIIDTTQGNMLMLCILVIILFVGVAITLIKNKRHRQIAFAGFATIGYGLLLFLKFSMPISPNTGKVEFVESFSIMPQGNTILLCTAIAAVVIIITSVFVGYNLYVGKSNSTKQY
jgi:type IV secretory pathway VirB2 component (pilin)